MKKVLFVATVDSHIRHFHIPYLKLFHDKGFEVHVATADDEGEKFDYCDEKHKITFERSPFKLNNLKAVNQMVSLIKEEKFDVIHCHTPMGSVVTRLAVRKLRRHHKNNDDVQRANKETISSGTQSTLDKGTNRSGAQCAPQEDSTLWSPNTMQVIYTAHGFHFFKGAPLKNWLIYYPIEKWLSKYTDKLITINKEDYDLAKNKKFKAKKIYKIDGVGVDAGKFNFTMSEEEKKKLKKELSSLNGDFKINKGDIVVTYVAELIKRKNQDLIIDVMNNICSVAHCASENDTNRSGAHCAPENIKLLLVGTGALRQYYEKRIQKLHLEQNILLTGYRKDVPKILKISDIAISCARHEGLPFNLVEAQMSGLPCVATDVRGNNEVIEENKTGYLISLKDSKKATEKFENKLLKLCNSESMRERMGKNALENSKKYKLSRIIDEMKIIYEE